MALFLESCLSRNFSNVGPKLNSTVLRFNHVQSHGVWHASSYQQQKFLADSSGSGDIAWWITDSTRMNRNILPPRGRLFPETVAGMYCYENGRAAFSKGWSIVQLQTTLHGRVLMHSTIKHGVGEWTSHTSGTRRISGRNPKDNKTFKVGSKSRWEGEALILFNFLSMHKNLPSHPLPLLLLACAA